MKACFFSAVIHVVLIFSFTEVLQAETVVLQPGPDQSQDIWTTNIYSYAPDGSFPGGGLADERLRVGGYSDLYYSLVQFNLQGLPAQATSVVISLFHFTSEGGTPTEIVLHRNTQQWDWRTTGTGRDHDRLWWADLPQSVFVSPQLPMPAIGTWYNIDVTSLYNNWQNGTFQNFGIQLRPTANSNNWSTFYSSRYGGDPTLRPKLTVTSVPEPTPHLFVFVGGLALLLRNTRCVR